MTIAFSILLLLHGLAHLVGFLVPWQLTKGSRTGYKTTIVGGRDVGASGMRLIGIFYLLLAVAFVAMAIGSYLGTPWARQGTLFVAGMSLFMCVVNWPETRVGLIVNVVIIGYLMFSAA